MQATITDEQMLLVPLQVLVPESLIDVLILPVEHWVIEDASQE